MMSRFVPRIGRTLRPAAGLALLVPVGPALAGNYLSENMEIFAIEEAKDWTGVGAVFNRLGDTAIFNGSASLINPGDNDGDGFDDTDIAWAITAAHVIDGADVAFIGTGQRIDNMELWAVDSWYIPATYNGSVVSDSDIALVRLSEVPTEANERYNIYRGGVEVSQEFTTVGFGENGTGSYLLAENGAGVFFDGNKRAGRNRYDTLAGANNQTLISDFDIDRDDDLYLPLYEVYYATINDGFIFDDPDNPADPRSQGEVDFRIPYEFAPDNGDSGGPQFLGKDIASVTSYGAFPWAPPVTPDDPNNVDQELNDPDPDGHFGTQAGYTRTNVWADWIYTIIDKVENGVTLDETADNVLIGTEGTPIEVSPGIGGPSAGSAAAEMARVLTDYFDPNVDLDLRESLALLGRAIVDDNDFTLENAADKLGVDPATLPADPFAAYDLLLDEANSQLDGALDGSWELAAQAGFHSKYGYFLARDFEVGTIGPQGLDIAFDPNAFDQERVLILGDFDNDGDIDEDDIDLITGSINDPAFRDWADVDFDGENTIDDQIKLVTELIGTLMGDANLNGQIEQGDLDAVLQNWGATDAGWATGNFWADGVVDQNDLDAILQGWGGTAAPNFALNPGLIPEPGTVLSLASLGALLTLRRRSA